MATGMDTKILGTNSSYATPRIMSKRYLSAIVHPGDGPTGGPNVYEKVGMQKIWEDSELDYWGYSLNVSILEFWRKAHELYVRWPDTANRPRRRGVPFSVKESINIAEIPTTTGCPPLAFTPTDSTPVYQCCIDAVALFIDKTNM
ncbi:glutamyl-tRNA(Gln) amidotransferase subunit A [Diplocarpon rosae]|nr:glutamyl-tRNA(Gln) amidotransferase subunit A [Diplocarpon rosae]